ncbi:pilus assembly protein [Bordetella genomosp. 9]|uniref:Pilus assembly protein n=2 Tax=Bordetella genomosp. 9 TaxID=1416803 RepID=A0A1W6YVH8_9BORD|nr:pilus assembly protein [Bordetella genomosp. 9]
MGKRALLTAMLGMLSLPVYSAPEISIGTLYDYLEPGKSSMLKRVRNNGDVTAFVKVSVSEVIYDSDGKPSERPTDVATFSKKGGEGMVASPTRLIVPAGGTQAARLLYRGSRERERYYRVRFVPVLPEKQDEFAVSEEEREQYNEAMSAGVNVLAGYGTFVIVRPAKERYDTKLIDGGDTYTVANNGNATVVLDAFFNCAADAKNCESPTVHHVLPGKKMVVAKTAGRTYRFELIEGKHKREVRFGK